MPRPQPQSIAHLLNRTAFGPSTADWQRAERLGTEGWIDEQLQPEDIEDGAADTVLAGLETLRQDIGTLMREYPSPQQVQRSMRDDEEPDEEMLRRVGRRSFIPMQQLARARLVRAVGSRRQLQEVLVDFWFNHFNVFAGKGPVRYLVPSYEHEVIRPHVLGRFRELLGAVARSPAMLVYLDNWRSGAEHDRAVSGPAPWRLGRGDAIRDAIRRRNSMRSQQRAAPQARFGQRPEGLNENYARELMELHTLGVDGGYSQADVRETARALTGWTLRLAPQGSGGFVFRPDWHDAEAKSVLGRHLASGRGIEDGEQVLDMLAEHPSTARFLATKLCRRLVSDAPSAALIAATATEFSRSDGDLRATTAVILRSEEFADSASRGAKVKSPLEFLASAARALELPASADPRLVLALRSLGEPLYRASAPTGYVDDAMARIGANALLARMQVGTRLAEAVYGRREPAGGTVAERVRDVVASLLPGREVAALSDKLIGWAQGRADEVTDAQIAALVLGSPEFQRR